MGILELLIIVILVMMLFSAPVWRYNREWGPYPLSGLGVVFIILLIILLLR